MRAIFEAHDANKDEIISKEEAKSMFEEYGTESDAMGNSFYGIPVDKRDTKDFEKFFSNIYKTNDESINRDELEIFML